MKERPILFSGPMVRAILAGTKTQTRRVVPEKRISVAGTVIGSETPYGDVGGRLWVRETWRRSLGASGEIHYAADLNDYNRREKGPWRPSIFLPRSASRIDLEILALREQCLHDITDEDILAEGVTVESALDLLGSRGARRLDGGKRMTPRHAWKLVWDAINGKREPWSSNPWVWAITFKRVRP